MSKKLISVIVRTLNEERYLDELLQSIKSQCKNKYDIETIIVDSGSTDRTLEIAKKYDCRITYISKKDFTFGRSLNYGCDFAKGTYLVFVSGHCIPVHKKWIENLVSPLSKKISVYSYGKQIGRDTTKYSEKQLFNKYFPAKSRAPQEGFFCNNANAAIIKDTWKKYKFDEDLTGCEDMYLAKQIVDDGYSISYIADAPVYHIHDESWQKLRLRYEREAMALRKILPEIHVSVLDTIKYVIVGILKDCRSALKDKVFLQEIYSIIRFRFSQYYGAYKGNHEHRKLSYKMKQRYFYPRVTKMDIKKYD